MRGRRTAVLNRQFVFGVFVISLIIIGSLIFGASKTQAAPAEPSYKYYTSIRIEQGETLWNIANEYMTEEYASTDEYISELCDLNRISPDHPIHAGQYLTVPYYSSEYYD